MHSIEVLMLLESTLDYCCCENRDIKTLCGCNYGPCGCNSLSRRNLSRKVVARRWQNTVQFFVRGRVGKLDWTDSIRKSRIWWDQNKEGENSGQLCELETHKSEFILTSSCLVKPDQPKIGLVRIRMVFGMTMLPKSHRCWNSNLCRVKTRSTHNCLVRLRMEFGLLPEALKPYKNLAEN